MTGQLQFTADVDERGHLPKTRRAQIAAFLRQRAGGPVQVTLGNPRRSTRANAFYWGCVIAPVQHAYLTTAARAYADWQLHEHFKSLYLPVVAAEWMSEYGEVVPFAEEGEGPDGRVQRRLTTTLLDPAQFSAYVGCIANDDAVLAMGVEFEAVPKGLRSGRIEEPTT